MCASTTSCAGSAFDSCSAAGAGMRCLHSCSHNPLPRFYLSLVHMNCPQDAAITMLKQDAAANSKLFLLFLSDGAPSDHTDMECPHGVAVWQPDPNALGRSRCEPWPPVTHWLWESGLQPRGPTWCIPLSACSALPRYGTTRAGTFIPERLPELAIRQIPPHLYSNIVRACPRPSTSGLGWPALKITAENVGSHA